MGVLKKHQACGKVPNLVRRHGVSEHTMYRWKSKFGGMEVSESKRLKELEAGNAKLTRLYADPMLDSGAMKNLLSI